MYNFYFENTITNNPERFFVKCNSVSEAGNIIACKFEGRRWHNGFIFDDYKHLGHCTDEEVKEMGYPVFTMDSEPAPRMEERRICHEKPQRNTFYYTNNIGIHKEFTVYENDINKHGEKLVMVWVRNGGMCYRGYYSTKEIAEHLKNYNIDYFTP